MLEAMIAHPSSRVAGCIAFICLFSSIVMAQQARRGARGNVRVLIKLEADPGSMKSIRLRLESISGGFSESAVLNAERSHVFNRVPRGQYTLTAECDGYSDSEKPVGLNPFHRMDEVFVTVSLKLEEENPLPGVGAETVSVETLSVPKKAREAFKEAEEARKHPLKAIEHLLRAIEICPAFYQAYNNLAVQYLSLGRTEEAREALLRSIEIEPDDPTTHLNLAEIYLGQAKYLESLRALNQAFGIDRESSRGFRLLGEAFLGLRRCDVAVSYFLSALERDPKERSFLGLARCYLEAGEKAKAREELVAFLREFKDDPRVESVKTTLAQIN